MKEVLLIGGVGLIGYLLYKKYMDKKDDCGCNSTDVTVIKDKLAPSTAVPSASVNKNAPTVANAFAAITPTDNLPLSPVQQQNVGIMGGGYNHADLLVL